MTTISNDGKVLGAVILARHGDREGFYQDATTYAPANTAITPLGSQQEYLLGQFLRSVYLDSSSPSLVSGFHSFVADDAQFKIRADAGGERGVIFNSAVSMLQGLFPPTPQYNITLANGTTIVGPLGGYQAIPIESVESEQDISLEGWVSCNTFTANTQKFLESSEFSQRKAESSAFLGQLTPYLGGRPATLENMWNVFDYMNVQTIHNKTFAATLPPGYLAQAHDLANWQQANIFSSPTADGIGNVAGRTMVASILSGLASISDPKDPMKILYQAISYKPFISLFRMAGAVDLSPQLAGIVNYASAVSFELRAPISGGEPTVRLLFKNGTDETTFTEYGMMGFPTGVPLSKFVNVLAPTGVNSTDAWCAACSNTQDRGCAALALAKAQGAKSVELPAIGSVGAGFLGAGLALAFSLAAFGVLIFLGVLTLGKTRSVGRTKPLEHSLHGSDTESQADSTKV